MESPHDARRGRAHNHKLAGRADFHDINWHHYTHPQLYNMVMSAEPESITDRAGQWKDLASVIEETTVGVRQILSSLFTTWQGGAAESARVSSDRLAQWAEQMTHRTDKIADRLHEYVEALYTARAKMPPPEFAWAEHAAMQGDPFKIVNGPAGEIELQQLMDDQKPNFDKHHDAWLEAVRVMSNYGQQSQGVHDGLPEHYEPAPATGQLDPGIRPWLPKDPRPLPPEPIGEPTPVGSGVPGDIDGDGIPDGTTPGGYTPAGAGAQTGYGTGVFAGSGPGSGAGADTPRAAPGGIAGANPLAARGGAGGMAGARGAGGANTFAPLGAGAGAQREEDKEHTTRFVEGVDWMDEIPPAFPPVLGA